MERVEIWIPGVIVNPGASGWMWLKRYRLANTIREQVAQHVLVTLGRRPPWPVTAPKRVIFTGYVARLFDDDRFPYALAPYRDGLMDCGMFSPRTLITKKSKHMGQVARGRGDGPEHGHAYEYTQEVSRGAGAKRGVLIQVMLR